MLPEPRLRPDTDRLAQLLTGPAGAETLALLQKLRLRGQSRGQSPGAGPQPPADRLGVWRVEPGPDGVALRRVATEPGWADVDYLPAAGTARRVVLLGESAARGWPYDPALTCAQVLARQLAAARPGGYQCLDLARTGATTADLDRLAQRLPLAAPDLVVSFVGNNWTLGPHAEEVPATDPDRMVLSDALARALRRDGYPGMRDVLQSTILDRARGFLDRLVQLHRDHGTRIVVVVPEFNLRGWTPPADLQAPRLLPAALAEWHRLHAAALRAGHAHRWDEAARLADRMQRLDGGTSPVPGYLAGQAALASGDGAAARTALEDSRDAVCGLLVRYVPRTTRPIQQLLTSYAHRHGWGYVDLRATLAAGPPPALPDERYFHDYCHLSDTGIERAMAAVTDTILDRLPGTTPSGPGLPPPARALGRVHAAVHLAYTGQPAGTVQARLRDAIGIAPELVPTLAALRELLAAPAPRWTHPAAGQLATVPQAQEFLAALAATRALPPWLWVLREALAGTGGPEPAVDQAPEIDLLAGGQANPTWLACSHHRATTPLSTLPFALRRPTGATLVLTYRTPGNPGPATARVRLNGAPVDALPARPHWTDRTLAVPAGRTRPGVNHLAIDWPVPTVAGPDAGAEADAAALARGGLPQVLPIYGEMFTARLHPDRP